MNHSLRIVVADDEPDMQEYFQRILPRLGHQVVGVASDGGELIDLCRRCRPDLVITDVRMPGLDGLAATRTVVRERPVPVVLVSALGDALSDGGRAESTHVMCCLVKPLRQGELGPALDLACRKFAEAAAQLKAAGPTE